MKHHTIKLFGDAAQRINSTSIMHATVTPADVTDQEYFDRSIVGILDTAFDQRRDGSLEDRSPIIFQFDARTTKNLERLNEFGIIANRERDRNPNNVVAAIYLQHWKIRADIYNADGNRNGRFDSEHLIDAVRASVFRNMILNSGALYRAPSKHFFRLPSGGYSDHFLRTGNIQSHRGNLDALSFWMAPHLQGSDLIISESWTISTLTYHVCRYLEEYSKEPLDEATGIAKFLSSFRSKPPLEKRITPAYLSAHQGKMETKISEVSSVSEQLDERPKKATFLYSARFSGREQREVGQAVSASGLGPAQSNSLVIFDMAEEPIDGNFLYAPRFEDKGFEVKVPKEREEFRAIDINGRTFFPDYDAKGVSGILRSTHVAPVKDFFERYAGSGVFHVHRTTKNSPLHGERHHAFYVDFAKLLPHPIFQTLLQSKLAQFRTDEIEKIVFQDTPNNRLLFDAVKSRFPDTKPVILRNYDPAGLDELTRTDFNATAPSKRILVLDSVVVTGTTLGKISAFFREFNDLSLTYFCGLMRPDLEDKKSRFEREVGASDNDDDHDLIFVEEVILPNWHKDRCPWCRESKVLAEDNLEKFDFSEVTLDRLRLRRSFLSAQADTGVTTSAFLTTLQDGEQLLLGENSVLLNLQLANKFRNEVGLGPITSEDVSEADVAVCLAAIAQVWRKPFFLSYLTDTLDNSHSPEDPNEAVKPVFDRLKDNVVSGRTTYTDPIIRAAIWRAFQGDELLPRPAGEEVDFNDFVASVLGDEGEGPNDRLIRDELLLLLGLSDFPYSELVSESTDKREFFELSSATVKK